MFDANELMKQLKISQNDPKAAQTINNLKYFKLLKIYFRIFYL